MDCKAEKWWRVVFPFPDDADGTHIKTHVVPDSLLQPLLADLKARYQQDPHEVVEQPDYWVDYGGMAVGGEPEISTEVAGLKVEMKVHFFDGFLRALKNSKPRRFADGPEYVKHHAWFLCLVLTLEQEDELHQKLAVQSDEAHRLDDEFMDRLKPVVAELKKNPHLHMNDLPVRPVEPVGN
jgi:hypothetical protein